jgi:hypothetical protein
LLGLLDLAGSTRGVLHPTHFRFSTQREAAKSKRYNTSNYANNPFH